MLTIGKHLLLFFCLCVSVPWEVHDDRKGDDHSKRMDLVWRSVLWSLGAWLNWYFLDKNIGASVYLAWAIHFLTFDYYVAAKLYANKVINSKGDWFSYLGKSSELDKFRIWRNATPAQRFAMRVAFLVPALIWYF
jgi:hypothetical protein